MVHHAARGVDTRTLRLTEDSSHIAWLEDGSTVPLAHVQNIVRGANAHAPPGCGERCFVLEGPGLGLCFETVDRDTRELIADGFELLVC